MAVSPQLPRHNRRIAKRHGLAFDVLSDPGNRTADRFGLVYRVPDDLKRLYLRFPIDLEKFNGDDSWILPMPARFVAGTDGILVAADADPDYTMRPEPTDTVGALRALAGRS